MPPDSDSLSPALAHYTNGANMSPNLRPHAETFGPPTLRELVCAAISVLWHTLQPEPGEELYPPVVTGLQERLEPLIQLRCVWGEGSVAGSTAQLGASLTETGVREEEEKEWELFTEVLRDGYVLCR